MVTGELKRKVDRLWDTFWSGGISNPLEVIEQITYLLFIKRLDDLQTLAENKANRTGDPVDRQLFPAGSQDLRWSRFRELDCYHRLRPPEAVRSGCGAGVRGRL